MKFVKLHELSNERPIFLNPQLIVAVESHHDRDGEYTRIMCSASVSYDVVELISVAMSAIERIDRA